MLWKEFTSLKLPCREKASRGGLWSLACLEDHKLTLRCGWGHSIVLKNV